MLSRVAERVYWLGRFLERTENTARLLLVRHNAVLDLPKEALRRLCDTDHTLGYAVMNLVARALAQRLHGTRLQMLDLFSETEPTPFHHVGSGRK